MTFGEKLKYYRKKAGLTQKELAEKAELSFNTICNYEKGNTYPKDRSVYEKLAEILGVDVDELKNEGPRYRIGVDAGKYLLDSPFGGSTDFPGLVSPEIVWGDPEPQLSEEQIKAIEEKSDPFRRTYSVLLKGTHGYMPKLSKEQLEKSKVLHQTFFINKNEKTLSEQFVEAMSSFFADPQISNNHKKEAMHQLLLFYVQYTQDKKDSEDESDDE